MSKEVKISVIKFEMVNGKKTYKSFTFKLNPKEMAKFKTEATVKKKVAEYVAKSGVYKPSELQNLKYDMKEFLEEWKKMVPVVEAEELAKLDKSPNNPETRVTPHLISRLAAGEIFVFGSNAMGYHDGGAAKTAVDRGLSGVIIGDEEIITIELRPHLLIIEALVAIDDRILAIVFLHQVSKHLYAILQLSSLPSSLDAFLLHIQYRNQVLLTLLHHLLEIPELSSY
jgi:hypothetical protein